MTYPKPTDAIEALRELLEAGEDSVNAEDDVAAMMRFGEASERAHAVLASYDAQPGHILEFVCARCGVKASECQSVVVRDSDDPTSWPPLPEATP
jgi:hypothetical protein